MSSPRALDDDQELLLKDLIKVQTKRKECPTQQQQQQEDEFRRHVLLASQSSGSPQQTSRLKRSTSKKRGHDDVEAGQGNKEKEEDFNNQRVVKGATPARGFSRRAGMPLMQRFFHLPIDEAAKQCGVSTTIIKRVCRRLNIKKWPYRKISSVDKALQHAAILSLTAKGVEKQRLNSKLQSLLKKQELLNTRLRDPNGPGDLDELDILVTSDDDEQDKSAPNVDLCKILKLERHDMAQLIFGFPDLVGYTDEGCDKRNNSLHSKELGTREFHPGLDQLQKKTEARTHLSQKQRSKTKDGNPGIRRRGRSIHLQVINEGMMQQPVPSAECSGSTIAVRAVAPQLDQYMGHRGSKPTNAYSGQGSTGATPPRQQASDFVPPRSAGPESSHTCKPSSMYPPLFTSSALDKALFPPTDPPTQLKRHSFPSTPPPSTSAQAHNPPNQRWQGGTEGARWVEVGESRNTRNWTDNEGKTQQVQQPTFRLSNTSFPFRPPCRGQSFRRYQIQHPDFYPRGPGKDLNSEVCHLKESLQERDHLIHVLKERINYLEHAAANTSISGSPSTTGSITIAPPHWAGHRERVDHPPFRAPNCGVDRYSCRGNIPSCSKLSTSGSISPSTPISTSTSLSRHGVSRPHTHPQYPHGNGLDILAGHAANCTPVSDMSSIASTCVTRKFDDRSSGLCHSTSFLPSSRDPASSTTGSRFTSNNGMWSPASPSQTTLSNRPNGNRMLRSNSSPPSAATHSITNREEEHSTGGRLNSYASDSSGCRDSMQGRAGQRGSLDVSSYPPATRRCQALEGIGGRGRSEVEVVRSEDVRAERIEGQGTGHGKGKTWQAGSGECGEGKVSEVRRKVGRVGKLFQSEILKIEVGTSEI